jgi:hypothetical protein
MLALPIGKSKARCPSCGRETIGYWQKFSTGCGSWTTCRACHAKLTVPPYDLLVLALVVIVGNFMRSALPVALSLAVIYVVLRHRYVPLKVKGKRSQQVDPPA